MCLAQSTVAAAAAALVVALAAAAAYSLPLLQCAVILNDTVQCVVRLLLGVVMILCYSRVCAVCTIALYYVVIGGRSSVCRSWCSA
jgi:hypothetical protein